MYPPRFVHTNFNPRIPYGMRQEMTKYAGKHAAISIHASRMGCDTGTMKTINGGNYFNPRIPYGMRPAASTAKDKDAHISIHASRMGCDP